MGDWRFSIAGDLWRETVDAVLTEETKPAFWERAVPVLATHAGPAPPQPCIVVCRVTAAGMSGNRPTSPLGRAKGLLDALHDDRKTGPWFRELPGRAPLPDDNPNHVSGLAVEVQTGDPQTEYLLGAELAIVGEMLASVQVAVEAPNDIWGTQAEKAKIAATRIAFGAAVADAFSAHPALIDSSPVALVVRHRPQRDEDNTWATWVAAACGARSQGHRHWASGAPLQGWRPMSIASVADPALEVPVAYEIWR